MSGPDGRGETEGGSGKSEEERRQGFLQILGNLYNIFVKKPAPLPSTKPTEERPNLNDDEPKHPLEVKGEEPADDAAKLQCEDQDRQNKRRRVDDINESFRTPPSMSQLGSKDIFMTPPRAASTSAKPHPKSMWTVNGVSDHGHQTNTETRATLPKGSPVYNFPISRKRQLSIQNRHSSSRNNSTRRAIARGRTSFGSPEKFQYGRGTGLRSATEGASLRNGNYIEMLSPTAARYKTDMKSNMSPPENLEEAKKRLYVTPLKLSQSLTGGGNDDSRQEYKAFLKEHDARSRTRWRERPSKGPSAAEPIVLDSAPEILSNSESRGAGQSPDRASSSLHTPKSMIKHQKSSEFGLSEELRRQIQSVEERSRKASWSGAELEIKSLQMTLKFFEINKTRILEKKEEVEIEDLSKAPLSPEENEQVDNAIDVDLDLSEILVSHKQEGADITRDKICCLCPREWLNDDVINLYLRLLKDRELRSSSYPKCHFFSTFFFNKLYNDARKYDYSNVRRWTRPAKFKNRGLDPYVIKDMDMVFVPIHEGVHWTLCIANIKEKKFMFLDSMSGSDRYNSLPNVARWLADEIKDKSQENWDTSKWEKEIVKCPQQQNGYDCGLFMLKFTDYFSRGLKPNFTQSDMPHYRRRLIRDLLFLEAP